MPALRYLKLWLACARYSFIRAMMFRLDFTMWALVELFWMAVNVSMIYVVYAHTESVAGWSKYEMLLLIGSSMFTQRMLMGLFWSNLFELGRNVRNGNFDFFLAQPGRVLFMAATRKLDLDSLANVFVAGAIVLYAAEQLQLTLTLGTIALYLALIGCAVIIHFSLLLLIVSSTFWIVKTEGMEGSYFTLTEFSRLPRQAFSGVTEVLFVWVLPVVAMSNVPAVALKGGLTLGHVGWLAACALGWLSLAIFTFERGIKRYSSASS